MSDAQPLVYLLDVEGTVAPVSLVYDQLFPYASRHLAEFLKAHAYESGVSGDLELLVRENFADPDESAPLVRNAGDLAAVTAYLQWLMDQDRKSTALKSLQGRIWKSGFEAGELVGTVFADVPEALKRWSAKSQVAIYSSGSVAAQQLFFRHSNAGDLTPLIAGYFDTKTGAKGSAASYRAIAAAMSVVPANLLFVSDVVRELDAAYEAGCQTRLAIRPGNAPVEGAHGYMQVHSFSEIS